MGRGDDPEQVYRLPGQADQARRAHALVSSTEKWGDPVIGLDGNRIIFAAASANGISEKNSKSDFVIGKFTAKVSQDAKVGEYEITLEDATTADIGKYYGANMQFNALKIVVET